MNKKELENKVKELKADMKNFENVVIFNFKRLSKDVKKIKPLYEYLGLEYINEECKTNIVRKINKSKK